MVKLNLSKEFLSDFAKLDQRIRRRTHELIDIFGQASSAADLSSQKGIHLETHVNQKDPQARTIRITDNWRGILWASADNKSFILHKILTHDDAELWMSRNQFRANVKTGAVEVVDIHAAEAVAVAAAQSTGTSTGTTLLYQHRSDKEFIQLGIKLEFLPALRAFTNDDQLGAILPLIPENQAEALIELQGQEPVEVIHQHIAGSFVPDSINEDDLLIAIEAPASHSQFKTVIDEDDLRAMMERPLAQWRVFLHHSQKEVTTRDFRGPARVTGGAGTGKTVVALHRAKHLADQFAGQLDYGGGKPILFTTFTRNLAQAIERDLRKLGGSNLLDAVEVINVDRLSHRVVKEAGSGSINLCNDQDLERNWQSVVNELGIALSAEFLLNEWEQVILAQQCHTQQDYMAARRTGRGIPLSRRDRQEVWKAVELFAQKLDQQRKQTFLQMADTAAEYLAQRSVRPYQHIIVDEAQDLHEAQWRLLRAAVAEGSNDLFIVGDSHQRIYDRRASLSQMGINIRGRSRRLRVNYRTTHEILRWALVLLGEEDYDDLDEGTDTLEIGHYFSLRSGPEPTLCGAGTPSEQLDALVKQIGRWVRDGVHPEDIGVAGRTRADLNSVVPRLRGAGLKVCPLDRNLPTDSGIRVATMHRMKGLEFRCIAVTAASDDRIPLRHALTDRNRDEVQFRRDLMTERSLLYVACSRAREHLWIGWSGTPSRFLGPHLDF